jgi:cell wall-associated NlpC family hydrolase
VDGETIKELASRKRIVWKLMESMLNTPYRWGGDDPIYGWDCSGAVIEVLKAGGWLPPHIDMTAQGLFSRFEKFPRYRPENSEFLDLVFFGRSEDNITHVAISLGCGLLWEAGGGTSRTRSLAAAADRNAYIRIRPINRRTDLVSIIRFADSC